MTDFSFISGQVQALQGKLLDQNKIDRMVGSKTPDDAFRVLTDLQYAEYFDNATQTKDFENILDQGLLEAKQMIYKGCDQDERVELLWKYFDINNIKRALKERFIESHSKMSEFNSNNGYSPLGSYDGERVAAIVFSPETIDITADSILDAVGCQQKNIDKNINIQSIERAMDQAFFDEVLQIANKYNSNFLHQWGTFQVDRANIMSALRQIFVKELSIDEALFITGGNYDVSYFTEIKTVDDAKKFIENSIYFRAFACLAKTNTGEELTLALERRFNQLYFDLLREYSSEHSVSLAIPFYYFEQRVRAAQIIKFIMFAKFNDLSAEQIYAVLSDF